MRKDLSKIITETENKSKICLHFVKDGEADGSFTGIRIKSDDESQEYIYLKPLDKSEKSVIYVLDFNKRQLFRVPHKNKKPTEIQPYAMVKTYEVIQE